MTMARAPRQVRRWIEQVYSQRSSATPFPSTERAAGQLQGGPEHVLV